MKEITILHEQKYWCNTCKRGFICFEEVGEEAERFCPYCGGKNIEMAD